MDRPGMLPVSTDSRRCYSVARRRMDGLEAGSSMLYVPNRARSTIAILILVTCSLLALVGEAVSVPEAPARMDLDVLSGDEVAVYFSAPLSDGGSAVQSYEVRRRHWDTIECRPSEIKRGFLCLADYTLV